MSRSNDQLINTPISQFFELRRSPFPQIMASNDIYMLPHVSDIAGMCEFSFQNGLYYAVIGAVGCGKSSALRYSCERLGRNQHAYVISVTGGMWSFTEFLRQLLAELGYDFRQYQPSTMVRMIQEKLIAIQGEGKKCIVLIDEAHLLKGDVFSQMHILAQNAQSKHPLFSLMLCGQEELAEKLSTPPARPLMSRIAEGYYVPPIGREDFVSYIDHHMKIAGARSQIFDDLALDALWQTSNANLRTIGNNALAALQWAANNGDRTVTAECVRKSRRTMWGEQGRAPSPAASDNMPDFSNGRRS